MKLTLLAALAASMLVQSARAAEVLTYSPRPPISTIAFHFTPSFADGFPLGNPPDLDPFTLTAEVFVRYEALIYDDTHTLGSLTANVSGIAAENDQQHTISFDVLSRHYDLTFAIDGETDTGFPAVMVDIATDETAWRLGPVTGEGVSTVPWSNIEVDGVRPLRRSRRWLLTGIDPIFIDYAPEVGIEDLNFARLMWGLTVELEGVTSLRMRPIQMPGGGGRVPEPSTLVLIVALGFLYRWWFTFNSGTTPISASAATAPE